jgi:AraC-like DNA-binding protein
VSHQTLARRFGISTGLPPKHFARLCRFQALVHLLLATDVEQWGVTAPKLGFYDQAHMINEFRTFAGQPPTTFFQPHGQDAPSRKSGLHGRPCEWARPAVSKDA